MKIVELYVSTICITKKEANFYNKILRRKKALPDCDRDAVIETFTIGFSTKDSKKEFYEADIKVCNGDSPYIDSVLFTKNYDGMWHELIVLEPSDTLIGDYVFDYEFEDGKWRRFKVIIKLEDEGLDKIN